jgi:alpha-L-fucosidase
MYYNSVGRNCNLIIGVTPDRSGLIPEADVKRLAEFGAEVKRRFGKSIAETSGNADAIELDLDTPQKIEHIIIMEDIRQGERVREYHVDGFANNDWKELCAGSSIGHKRIEKFAPVEVAKIRLHCTKTTATPQIRKLAVY